MTRKDLEDLACEHEMAQRSYEELCGINIREISITVRVNRDLQKRQAMKRLLAAEDAYKRALDLYAAEQDAQ